MPIAATRSSADVRAKPFFQNTGMARRRATSLSNSLGRAIAGMMAVFDRIVKNTAIATKALRAQAASSRMRQLTGAATLVRILTIVTSRADRQPASAADPDRAATLQLIIALGRALQALEQVVGPHLVQHGLSLT